MHSPHAVAGVPRSKGSHQHKVRQMLVPHGTPELKEAYQCEQRRYIPALLQAPLENNGKDDTEKDVMS